MSDYVLYFEYLIITAILVLQCKYFLEVKREIFAFKIIFPDIHSLSIKKCNINKEVFYDTPPNDILNGLTDGVAVVPELLRERQQYQTDKEFFISRKSHYQSNGYNVDESRDKAKKDCKELANYRANVVSVLLLEVRGGGSDAMTSIKQSINHYLLRNKGAVADFYLIRDIVERIISTKDDNITLFISVPLYLGLLGTFIGIVIGLFNVSSLQNAGDGKAIEVLLNGVKVAMLASFIGLLLTIYNSAWNYRKAKVILDGKKNDFYTFLQTELLPKLNMEDASSIITLQRSMQRFAESFDESINSLRKQIRINYKTIKNQNDFLRSLEDLDLKKISAANIEMFKAFVKNAHHFEKFNEYLTSVDGYLEHTITLGQKVNDLLSRTDRFDKFADELRESVEAAKEVMLLLQQHKKELELRKNVVDEITTSLDSKMQAGLDKVTEHANALINALDVILTNTDTSFGEIVTKIQDKLDSSGAIEELKKLVAEATTLPAIVTTLTAEIVKISKEIDALKREYGKVAPAISGVGVAVEKVSTAVNSIKNKPQNSYSAPYNPPYNPGRKNTAPEPKPGAPPIIIAGKISFSEKMKLFVSWLKSKPFLNRLKRPDDKE